MNAKKLTIRQKSDIKYILKRLAIKLRDYKWQAVRFMKIY